jgi:hypothetical protein
MAAGSIVIDLLLKTGSFQTDTARSAKALREMKKEAEAFGKTIGIAFGIAQAAVIAYVKSQINALDTLNDLSDATGSTVENLSALEDVAARNGQTLEEVGSILVKFNKALGDVDGKNGVSQALKAIGLDAKALQDLDPAEALRQTAVALAGFADDGNKARIVQELFGKSIKEAGPFLKDLAEQGRLNATVTTEQAKAAEEFNKSIFGLQKNVADLARTLLSDLIPALNTTFREIKEGGFLKFLDDLDRAMGLTATDVPALKLIENLQRINEEIAGVQRKIDQAGKTDNAFAKAGIPKLEKQLADLRAEAAKTEKEMVALDASLNPGRGIYSNERDRRRGGSLAPLKPPDKDVTNPFDALIKSAREQLALAKAQGDAEDDLTQAMQARIKIQADLDAGTLKLTKKEKDLLFGILGETDALQKSNEEKKKATALSKQITEQLQEENDRRLEGQRQIRDSLEQEAKAAQEQAAAYGLSAEAVEALAIARERERANKLDARAQAESNALLDEEAAITRDQAKAIRAVADARQSVLDKNIALQNDPLTGATQGVKDYLTEISKAGDETRRITEGALHGLEDVLTSKDPVKAARALVSQLIAEFYRLLVIKPLMQSITGGSGGLEGLLKLFGSGSGNLQLGGAGGTTITPQLVGEFATGTPYIPKTGLALVHEGERVLTRKQNAEGWGRGGVTVNKVPANYEVETSQGSDGQLVLTMQRVANAAIDRAMKPGGRGRTGLRAQAPDRR